MYIAEKSPWRVQVQSPKTSVRKWSAAVEAWTMDLWRERPTQWIQLYCWYYNSMSEKDPNCLPVSGSYFPWTVCCDKLACFTFVRTLKLFVSTLHESAKVTPKPRGIYKFSTSSTNRHPSDTSERQINVSYILWLLCKNVVNVVLFKNASTGRNVATCVVERICSEALINRD